MDSPPEIDVKLRDKVWQAHGKLTHLAIWARPDLVHSISVLGKYVHKPSEKLWNAYSRIAKYLVKTRDLKLVYGTPNIELMDLEPYGHSDSDWGGCIDDKIYTGRRLYLPFARRSNQLEIKIETNGLLKLSRSRILRAVRRYKVSSEPSNADATTWIRKHEAYNYLLR